VVSQHVAASRRARLVCDSPTAALPSIFLAGMGRLVCPHASQRERADAEPRVLAGARGARVLQPPAQPGHRVGDPTMALSGAAGGASVDGQLCVRAGVPHVVPLAHGPAQGAHTRFGFTGFGASSRAFHHLRLHPARAPPAPSPTPPPSKSSTRPITYASTQQELPLESSRQGPPDCHAAASEPRFANERREGTRPDTLRRVWCGGVHEGQGTDEVEVEVPAALRKVFKRLPAVVMLPQSVQAERCRFIESTQCASVCVNTCKVPSQEWLFKDFGMNVHIRPNYDDFSCHWKFGA
jgi:hypothetical protein